MSNLARMIGSIALVLAVASHAGRAAAQPGVLSFSARVADASGALAGDHEIEVALYDAEAGGVALWTETHAAVAVEAGFVHVSLGSVVPFDAASFDGTDRWLSILVDDVPMEPRLRIHSVPYALLAGTAAVAEDVSCSGCVSSSELDFDPALQSELDAQAAALESRLLDAIASGDEALERRMTATHADLRSRDDALASQMGTGDAALRSRMDTEDAALRSQIAALQAQLDALTSRLGTAEAQLASARSRLDALEVNAPRRWSYSAAMSGLSFTASTVGGTNVCSSTSHPCQAWEAMVLDTLDRGLSGGITERVWVAGAFPNTADHMRSIVAGGGEFVCPVGQALVKYPSRFAHGAMTSPGGLHCETQASVLPVLCCPNDF